MVAGKAYCFNALTLATLASFNAGRFKSIDISATSFIEDATVSFARLANLSALSSRYFQSALSSLPPVNSSSVIVLSVAPLSTFSKDSTSLKGVAVAPTLYCPVTFFVSSGGSCAAARGTKQHSVQIHTRIGRVKTLFISYTF